jgi:hypothetical protein
MSDDDPDEGYEVVLIYAHAQHAPLKNIMTEIQFVTALDDHCHGKHE